MYKGMKPIIRDHIIKYIDENLNGFIEYEDVDYQTVAENVANDLNIEDIFLIEDLYFDIALDVIREYNEATAMDRHIKQTDERERLSSIGV